jgi:hypothetical protein
MAASRLRRRFSRVGQPGRRRFYIDMPGTANGGRRGTGNEKEAHIMAAGTVRLHRVLRAPPERVYRAFLDADAMAKWLPPNGFTARVHHLDATVGGTFRMSFTNFTTQQSHTFGGEYLELVPNERIRHTDRFDDPRFRA